MSKPLQADLRGKSPLGKRIAKRLSRAGSNVKHEEPEIVFVPLTVEELLVEYKIGFNGPKRPVDVQAIRQGSEINDSMRFSDEGSFLGGTWEDVVEYCLFSCDRMGSHDLRVLLSCYRRHLTSDQFLNILIEVWERHRSQGYPRNIGYLGMQARMYYFVSQWLIEWGNSDFQEHAVVTKLLLAVKKMLSQEQNNTFLLIFRKLRKPGETRRQQLQEIYKEDEAAAASLAESGGGGLIGGKKRRDYSHYMKIEASTQPPTRAMSGSLSGASNSPRSMHGRPVQDISPHVSAKAAPPRPLRQSPSDSRLKTSSLTMSASSIKSYQCDPLDTPEEIEKKAQRLISHLESSPPEFASNLAKRILYETDSDALAKQLTIYEWEMLKGIEMHELITLGFAKKDKNERAPKLMQLLSHFNKIGALFQELVLRRPNSKKMASALSKFYRVAKKLMKIRNYSGCLQVLSAFSSVNLTRLKGWKKYFPQEMMDHVDKMQRVFNSNGNYKEYRDLTIAIPYIPFTGVIMRDMTFISDGNSDFLDGKDGKVVNFTKMVILDKAFHGSLIHRAILQPYPYEKDPVIQACLKMMITKTNDELFALSKEIEQSKRRQTEDDPEIAALVAGRGSSWRNSDHSTTSASSCDSGSESDVSVATVDSLDMNLFRKKRSTWSETHPDPSTSSSLSSRSELDEDLGDCEEEMG